MMQILQYTWANFDEDIDILVRTIRQNMDMKQIETVYGVPRGGSILGVVLSHRLGITFSSGLVDSVNHDCLWCDDIIDSGRTLAKAKEQQWNGYVALINRYKQTTLCARIIDNENWIIFPWEDVEKAEQDYREYHASNK